MGEGGTRPSAARTAMKAIGEEQRLDGSAGRLRRLPTRKSPLAKGLRRAAYLKHTPRKLRKNLIQTNVLASELRGTQGRGSSPSTCRAYRSRIPRQGGFAFKLGCLTTGWRLFSDKAVDPLHEPGSSKSVVSLTL